MNIRYVIAGLVIIVVAGGGMYFMKSRQKPLAAVSEQIKDNKTKGSETARITIIEYSDFQCPACQQSQAPLNELLARYPAQIRLIYRHFPLPMHMWAPMAHQAAECAAGQGKFWEFHDRLYKEQLAWSGPSSPLETFLRYAGEAGLNLDEFGRCLADDQVRQRILAEKKEGDKLQIQSTPTFFVNGERMVGAVELQMRADAFIRKVLGFPPAPPPPVFAPSLPPPAPAEAPAA